MGFENFKKVETKVKVKVEDNGSANLRNETKEKTLVEEFVAGNPKINGEEKGKNWGQLYKDHIDEVKVPPKPTSEEVRAEVERQFPTEN